MPGRHHLFVPGPTNVPERVLRAMHRASEDHRSSAFPELTLPLFPRLRELFRTSDGQPFIFTSTGTGGWEAALTNTLSPGDRVLACRYGQFSNLFAGAAQRLGLDVEMLDAPWGEGAPAERIAQALSADHDRRIRGVLTVHNETSTGVTSDIAELRAAIDSVGHPALLYVDAVSSLGSIDFRMDDWGVDLAIAGTQKGLMMPAGLGLVCASARAMEASAGAKSPRSYFDFRLQIPQNEAGYFPYTPSLLMLYALRESMDILFEEGLEAVFGRHARLADGVRAAVDAWGLELCAREPRWMSNTVSTVVLPAGADARRVIDIAFRRYDLSLGGGMGELAGHAYRIGHMGDVNELMLLGALGGCEMAMRDAGMDVRLGSGMRAAAEAYQGGSD